MKLNWMAIGIGFIITLILSIIGFFMGIIGEIIGFLAPIIGGLVAGYLADGEYTDGAVNGAISAGVAGLISTFIIESIFGVSEAYTIAGYGLTFDIIFTAFVGLIIGGVLGLLGGIVGAVIKKK